MNFKAILLAMLIAAALFGALAGLAWVLELSVLSAPQTLTLFAVWSVPGYFAGKRAGEAGTLHGLVSGLLGMPLIVLGMESLSTLSGLPMSGILAGRPLLILTLLAGFWASAGGMLADSVRLIRAKRAARKAGVEPPGSGS